MIDEKLTIQKTILITGCGKNSLGSAIALKFSQQNFKVIATNLTLTDMTELDGNPSILKLEMDVTNSTQVNKVIGEIKDKVKIIDMVINCAGVYYSDFILNADEGVLDMLFNVNFKGTFNVCKVIVPMMISQGFGTVVNLSSDTSLLTSKYASIFNSIELGLKQMVKNFKLEVTGFNLDWILVQPRRIKSNFINNQLKSLETTNNQDPFASFNEVTYKQPDTSNFMTREEFADELLIQILKRTDIKYQYYYFLTNPINIIVYAIFFALCYFLPNLSPIWNFFKTNYWYLPNEIIIGESFINQILMFLFGLLPSNLQLLSTWIYWGLHNIPYSKNDSGGLDSTGVKMKEFS